MRREYAFGLPPAFSKEHEVQEMSVYSIESSIRIFPFSAPVSVFPRPKRVACRSTYVVPDVKSMRAPSSATLAASPVVDVTGACVFEQDTALALRRGKSVRRTRVPSRERMMIRCNLMDLPPNQRAQESGYMRMTQ